jgi:HD-like signal output (HDOD) protein
MSATPPATIKKYQHPALAGLSDKALVAFYSLGNIQSMESGSWLLRPGDKASDCFLILAGSAQLLASVDSTDQGHVLTQGCCLPVAHYQKAGVSVFALRAKGAVGVLRFNEAALAGLDPEVQQAITRNLAGLNAQTTAELLQAQLTQASSRQVYAQQTLDQLQEDLAYYSGSKPIVELLSKLPRLPSYATRLTQIMSDPNFSTKEAFETAKLDPSLTASVLKTVNSSAYGLKHKVMDFQHAFVLLGFHQIQQIIMNQGIQSVMPKTPEFQQLQLHSVMVSALCQEISLSVKQGNAPALGTIGLLHDIGVSVLLLLKREHPQLGFLINLLDADLIGTMLLREWGIPEDICSAMQYQSLPYKAPSYVIPEAHRVTMAVLYVAHLCFDFLMEKPLEGKQLRFCTEYLRVLGSNATSLENFVRDELLVSVQPRMNSLPKVIQNFLKKGMVLVSQQADASGLAPGLALDGAVAGKTGAA